MRVEMGYKFIVGFIFVIAAVAFVPYLTSLINLPAGLENIVSLLVAIVIGLLIGSTLSRSFSRSIRDLTTAAEDISKGNLSKRAILTSRPTFEDETVDLEEALKKMTANLSDMVVRMQENSSSVADSAQGLSATAEEMNASTQEISSTIEQIARGAELQTEMVERSSRLISEMADSIEKVALTAGEATERSIKTTSAAESGSRQAMEVVEKLKGVFGKIELSSEVVFRFGDKTHEIGKIVEVITQIAQQTNLLALNATIEAARAGEYGRGFAVVAEEIRKLAENSTQSAEQITGLIKEIEDESGKAVGSLRESTGLISEGRGGLETAGRALQDIVLMMKESSESLNSIHLLAQKQMQGSRSMVQAIDEIAKVAEDNAAATQEASAATEEQTASMDEMSAAAQELSTLADEMRKVTERFQV